MVRLSALLRLMRPINCLMMGFAVIVGAALVGENIFSENVLIPLLLGFFVGVFLTGSSMVVNDVIDREIDAVNVPSRPIPSGAVSVKEAWTFAAVLCFIGFGFTLAIGKWECFVIAVVAWLVFSLYSIRGKRTGFFGNLMVSICVVIPFIFGGFVVGKGFGEASAVFVAIVFLSNTGREVTKGIADIEGDKKEGVKTIAVRFGARVAAGLAAIFYVSSVVLSVLPWKLGLVSFWFVPFVLVTDVGLLSCSILLLRDFSRENARKIKNIVLFWFITGLFAFLAGNIW